jgi:hypothetical protein
MLQMAGFVLGPALIVLGLFMFIFGPRLMRETDRLRDGLGGEPTLSGLRTPRVGGVGFIVGGILVLVVDVICTVQNS